VASKARKALKPTGEAPEFISATQIPDNQISCEKALRWYRSYFIGSKNINQNSVISRSCAFEIQSSRPALTTTNIDDQPNMNFFWAHFSCIFGWLLLFEISLFCSMMSGFCLSSFRSGSLFQFDSKNSDMAKAALNMMTRTSSQDYAKSRIYMTSVFRFFVFFNPRQFRPDKKPAKKINFRKNNSVFHSYHVSTWSHMLAFGWRCPSSTQHRQAL
jgi:hypothetical protein